MTALDKFVWFDLGVAVGALVVFLIVVFVRNPRATRPRPLAYADTAAAPPGNVEDPTGDPAGLSLTWTDDWR